MNAALKGVEPRQYRPLDENARVVQSRLLERVSRTFALTIPRLPAELVDLVGNAYLLCRIVDTIEDELSVDENSKARLYARFLACLQDEQLEGVGPGEALATDIARLLPNEAPPGEIALVSLIPDVLVVTASFPQRQRLALHECVRIMTGGMQRFERLAVNGHGLDDVLMLERYCYHVAGCVGEMLTELFCLHDPGVAARREALMPLSVRFGYGLQLTNILKDMWLDHARGVCWLPADSFDLSCYPEPVTLPALMQRALDGDVAAIRIIDAGTCRLVAQCRGYLDEAMRYVRTLPVSQLGMRVFCLWSIGLAVLTLRRIARLNIEQRRAGTKVTRRSVRATLLFTNASARHERIMMLLYGSACIGLPRQRR